MDEKNYCAIGAQYIRDVLDEKIPTNKWMKLSCQRQIDDLARQGTKEFPFVFDEEAGNRVCEFVELLKHVKGSTGGQPIILEPWECYLLTVAFGWLDPTTATRRFKRCITFCGKGNGKSLISSALAIYALVADGEQGAEVLLAARAATQARIVFDSARDMLRANEELCKEFGIKVFQHDVRQKSTASVMRPCAANKNLDGCLPSMAIADETWAHRNRDVIDALERGIDKRWNSNSMLWTISHAGFNQACVGYEQAMVAQGILDKSIVDERTFANIWSAEGWDWRTREAWIAANPNFGVSVMEDAMREACERAKLLPSLQSSFRYRNLAEWVNADITWLDPQKIRACVDRSLRIQDFIYYTEAEGYEPGKIRRPFVLGLDLAGSQDIASVYSICMRVIDNVAHLYVFGRNYLPEETVKASPIAAYRGWAARNLVTVFPGPTNSYDEIENDITSSKVKYVAGSFDSWQSLYLKERLEKRGIEMIEFRKTTQHYSPVMDLFSALIVEGRLHFPNDEPLLWAVSNVVCHRDLNGNLFPRKATEDRKIDPAIAAMYALRGVMVEGGKYVKPRAPFTGIRFLEGGPRL